MILVILMTVNGLAKSLESKLRRQPVIRRLWHATTGGKRWKWLELVAAELISAKLVAAKSRLELIVELLRTKITMRRLLIPEITTQLLLTAAENGLIGGLRRGCLREWLITNLGCRRSRKLLGCIECGNLGEQCLDKRTGLRPEEFLQFGRAALEKLLGWARGRQQ